MRITTILLLSLLAACPPGPKDTGDETADPDSLPLNVLFLNPADGATVCGDVTVEAMVAEEGAWLEFFLDDTLQVTDDASPFTWAWDTSFTVNGAHQVGARASTGDGREGIATLSVTVANTGGECDNLPTVVFLAPVDGAWLAGEGAISVHATDDVGVVGLQFFLDGGLVAEDAYTPYEGVLSTGDFADGLHALKALATDTAGQSGTAQVAVNLDNTPPAVSFLSPSEAQEVDGTLDVVLDASDALALAAVEVSLDGIPLATFTGSPFSLSWDTTTADPGSHVLDALATDLAGNVGEARLRVEVDNPPTVALGTPAEGETVWGTVEVTASATDDEGVSTVAFAVDGGTRSTDPASPWSWSWDTCGLTRGSHTVSATATDLGRHTTTASADVTVDQPLQVQVGSPAGTVDPVASLLAWTDDDDAVTSVIFDLDGASVAVVGASTSSSGCAFACGCDAWTATWDTRSASAGVHTLTATATNARGETASDSVTVTVDHDADDDSFLALDYGGTDCDDGDPATFPGAPEICDGADQDCNGLVDEIFDVDGDGYQDASACPGGDDCDDLDPFTSPEGLEVCDGLDNDCDGDVDLSDEVGTLTFGVGGGLGITTFEEETAANVFLATEDGVLQAFRVMVDDSDSDDAWLRVYEATSRWDFNLVGSVPVDIPWSADWAESGPLDLPLVEGHWYALALSIAGPTFVHIDTDPDLPTTGGLQTLGWITESGTAPPSIDDDPYGYTLLEMQVDVDTIAEVDIDDDGDGFTEFCGDCDDDSALASPALDEVCADGADNDCDGSTDEYTDGDGDGTTTCTDCDDADPSAWPGAPETCDGVDDDCDGTVDEDPVDGVLQHVDGDGDGWGDPEATSSQCPGREGYTPDATDCDDGNASSYPGAPELCDGGDNDCDGVSDEGTDGDGDGWGACVDCDDGDPAVSPDATDLCDGIDDNCDGWLDTTGTFDTVVGYFGTRDYYDPYGAWYANVYRPTLDVILDSFEMSLQPDDPTMIYVAVLEATSSGGPYTVVAAQDIRMTGAGTLSSPTWSLRLVAGRYYAIGMGAPSDLHVYLDADSRVYTDTATTLAFQGGIASYGDEHPSTLTDTPDDEDEYLQTLRLRVPVSQDHDHDGDGFSTWCGDCDESQSATYPGAPESCNGRDDDCDGAVDQVFDGDGDGHLSVALCGDLGDDCDDLDGAVNPDALETCDGVDNDCDGFIDLSKPGADAGTFTWGEGAGSAAYGNDLYGNVYLPTHDTRLSRVQVWLDPSSASGTLYWRLYEATTSTGTYTLVTSSTTAFTSSAEAWFTWDLSDVTLLAGRYYLIGVGTSISTTYGYDSSPDLSTAHGLTPIGYIVDTSSASPASVIADPSTSRLYTQVLTVDSVPAADKDSDGDGYTPWCGDCDDGDGAVFPGSGC